MDYGYRNTPFPYQLYLVPGPIDGLVCLNEHGVAFAQIMQLGRVLELHRGNAFRLKSITSFAKLSNAQSDHLSLAWGHSRVLDNLDVAPVLSAPVYSALYLLQSVNVGHDEQSSGTNPPVNLQLFLPW